ncbi:MerR family transcriptional regulator [Streptomonospora algeriensis]|uniref:MerR family transcriptional regulator n=1 Tax=Streptomonospora algeriensis TaxID=995084 RepID=A0ABW3BAT1_9ACTN
MRIADAAAQVGVPPHRLRHYESTSLLVPERTPAGYRDYSPHDIARAKQIKALLDSGFTTGDVALMLPCMQPDPDPDPGLRCCADTTARLTARLDQIKERRARLEHTERALAAWLNLPNGDDTRTSSAAVSPTS